MLHYNIIHCQRKWLTMIFTGKLFIV